MLTLQIIICICCYFLTNAQAKSTSKKEYSVLTNKKKEPEGGTTNWLKYRYDVKTMKLTALESTDGCPPNMRFFAKPENDTMGECDCDYFNCNRALIYSPKTDQCHYGWTQYFDMEHNLDQEETVKWSDKSLQGPCESDEWFAFDDKLTPICEKNTCPPSKSENDSNGFYYKNPRDGECYVVGSSGFCKGENQFLASTLTEPIPSCHSYLVCSGLSVPNTQRCYAGHKLSYERLCK